MDTFDLVSKERVNTLRPAGGGDGQQFPNGAATKHTEQSTHQAAIWAALVYASTCLSRGSRVTLTIESGTALRNLIAAPAGATPTTLHMQAQTAARYEDIFAHVTLTGTVGGAAVWSPYGTRPECGTRGISHPRNARVPEGAPPQQSDALLAFRADGGVVWSTDGGWHAPRPPRRQRP